MSRREIIAGIAVVIGALALAAVLSRRSPPSSHTSVFGEIFSQRFDVIRVPDRFTERTPLKEGPEEKIAEPAVIYFPVSKESDGGESADDEDDFRWVIPETPPVVELRSEDWRRSARAYDPIDPKR